MDTKGNKLNSTRRTEEHDTRGTPEEQKKTRKGSVKNGRNKKHKRYTKTSRHTKRLQ